MRIIAGEWGGRRIEAPAGRVVRPTPDRVREAWMSALQTRIAGARVLDLFAGSGALGLEALSRGAASATFVERSGPVLRGLRRNVEALGAGDRATLIHGDAIEFAERLGRFDYDIALADPPYDRGHASDLLRLHGRMPFARELWVEHRSSEILPDLDGLHTRRYGDTSLTARTGSDE